MADQKKDSKSFLLQMAAREAFRIFARLQVASAAAFVGEAVLMPVEPKASLLEASADVVEGSAATS